MADTSLPDPPRFLADENFDLTIVIGLRRARPAMDILSASQAGTLGLSDEDVLAWAAAHDRILLTHDQRTMPDHFYRFLAQTPSGSHSPGVMLVSQSLAIGQAITAILEIWDVSAHAEWRDLLIRLPL